MEAQKIGQATLSGRRGAFVAMDVNDGSIYALGSSPTFDPNVFSKGVKTSVYKRLNDPNNGAPLANRAIAGPVSDRLDLQADHRGGRAQLRRGHARTRSSTTAAPSSSRARSSRHNAGNAVYGPINIAKALQVSSDVFFFNMGADLANSCGGLQLQKWARKLGIGRKTGIDLPGEGPGFLPTAAA